MPTSDFLHEATERGFVFQCTDTEALDAALRAGAGLRLYRLRLHRGQPACRQPGADHDAAPAAAARPSAGGADGRRHHADRRPVRQGRIPPVADRRADRRQHGRHPPLLRAVPALRRRADRRDHGRTTPTGWTRSATSPLLRDVGTHFTINRMLTFDSVQLRLEREQPLTFLEFNYMILQSYDFRELYRRHGVTLQMGGSDQWGNIVTGVELVRRTDGKHGVRPDHAADHHRLRRQDGQDRAGRGVADRRPAVAVRLLAVLAQHRGRRCRPLPAPVHRPAAGRDRPAGSAAAAPRSTRRRRSWPPRRPRWRTAATAAAAAAETARRAFEEGEAAETLPGVDGAARGTGRPASRRSACSRWPAWPPATARRAG